MVGGAALARRGWPSEQHTPPPYSNGGWGSSTSRPAESTPCSTSTTVPPAHPTSNAEHNNPTPGHPPGSLPYSAIIVPPLILVALILGLLFCLRSRRRRRQQQQQPPPPPPPSAPQNEIREYRSDNPPTINLPFAFSSSAEGPIILSQNNNAYLTGLDTPSEGSINENQEEEADYPPARRSLGGTFAEPPPPYKKDGSIHEGELPIQYSEIENMADRSRSPFEDPEYEVPVADGMLFEEHRSPFDDPESPVSEIDIGSRMMLARRTSDVSDL